MNPDTTAASAKAGADRPRAEPPPGARFRRGRGDRFAAAARGRRVRLPPGVGASAVRGEPVGHVLVGHPVVALVDPGSKRSSSSSKSSSPSSAGGISSPRVLSAFSAARSSSRTRSRSIRRSSGGSSAADVRRCIHRPVIASSPSRLSVSVRSGRLRAPRAVRGPGPGRAAARLPPPDGPLCKSP